MGETILRLSGCGALPGCVGVCRWTGTVSTPAGAAWRPPGSRAAVRLILKLCSCFWSLPPPHQGPRKLSTVFNLTSSPEVWFNPSSERRLDSIFPQFRRPSPCPASCFSCATRASWVDRIPLVCLCFASLVFGISPKKSLPVPTSASVLPVYPPSNFTVSGLTLRSLLCLPTDQRVKKMCCL